jgi:hypothetical protein
MKKLMVVLAVLLLSISCNKKDEPDYYYKISGQVLDKDTGAPIAQAGFYVRNYYLDANWEMQSNILAQDSTDVNGRFEIAYAFRKDYDTHVLMVSKLPDAYTNCLMFINGSQFDLTYHAGEPWLYQSGYKVGDGGFYQIEFKKR